MVELTVDHYFDLSKFAHASIFDNCQNVWDVLANIQNYLESYELGIIQTEVPKTAHLVDAEKISIGRGTVVEPGAYIKGPCVIGENCHVRQGAYIRGNFICGNACVIGHATEIKNSIFLDYAQAAHFAYVGDTVLGNHTNLGAGTKCANLRFDNQAVSVYLHDRKVNTHLRKFGAIFGDFSQSGCNSVTNPGTLLAMRSAIAPCVNARGYISEGNLFKEKKEVS